ncbi:MAG: hypothetical protein GY869_04465 [Planctomycetes bacterium]|nr:hypothetical protein [Planctomycetota bacterium]
MRRVILVAGVLLLVLTGSRAWSQIQAVSEQWRAGYSGPGNYYDELSDMAVDDAGCSYLAGYNYGDGTDRDYLVVKYDSQGYLLWRQRFNGTGNNRDVAVAVAVDPWGNVLVTGYSFGSGTNYDFATVKFDPAGNQLWAARYNGATNPNEYATDLAVDQQGNVYVTGYVQVYGSGSDCVTVKYDANGIQQWEQRYFGAGYGYHSGAAIKVDSQNNVIVCGYSEQMYSGRDYLVLKYDQNGAELWASLYTGPHQGYDEACALTVDAENSVYVTGRSYGFGTGADCVTVKYDADGNEIWSQRYSGPANAGDQGSKISLDSNGNVFVGGISKGFGDAYNYAIIKYNRLDGTEKWVRHYEADVEWDAPVDIGVDNNGDVYLSGQCNLTDNGIDYILVKYDNTGRARWIRWYDGPVNQDDQAIGMDFDESGNIYVSGLSRGGDTQEDIATIKYDPDGDQLWSARYNGEGISDDQVQALTLDNNGNVLVSGYVRNGLNYDFATVKYDNQGNRQWRRLYGQEQWSEQAQAMAADSTGNVYVTGYRGNRCVTVKYSAGGEELWAAEYDNPATSSDYAYALAIDSQDNILVGGYSYVSGGFGNNYMVIKYDPYGNQLWTAGYNSDNNGNDRAFEIATDLQNNVYVSGYSYGSGTSYDYATVKFDAQGNQLWIARYNGTGNSGDYVQDLTVDESGNVYVTGYVYNSGTGRDYATIKYDTNGAPLWTAIFDGAAHGSDYSQALQTDDWGNVYVTGYSYGVGTGYDITTVKYDSDGAEQWVAWYNDPVNNGDYARDISVDAEGNIYVLGYSYNNGLTDYVTIKYSPDSNEIWTTRYDGPVGLIDDMPRAMALDQRGNVYVGGVSGGVGTGQDFVTVKYSQLGAAPAGQPRTITIDKLKVQAGKRDPMQTEPTEDNFELWGTFDAAVSEIIDADSFRVTLWNQNEIVFTEQVPFDAENMKRGVYRVTGENGGITLFKFDLIKNKQKVQPDFRIEAKQVNLTGLSSPVILELEMGDYYGIGVAGESENDFLGMGLPDATYKDNINGPRKMPINLMLGHNDGLRVEQARVKTIKKDETESLNVRGSIAVKDRAIDLSQHLMTIRWGQNDFVATIPKGDFTEYKGKFVYSKPIGQTDPTNNPITLAIFDLEKCTFIITVNKAEIASTSGIVPFNISFGVFDQTDNYNLDKKKIH